MGVKNSLTYQQQIQRLKNRGLTVDSTSQVEKCRIVADKNKYKTTE